jgi:hypothetical protein
MKIELNISRYLFFLRAIYISEVISTTFLYISLVNKENYQYVVVSISILSYTCNLFRGVNSILKYLIYARKFEFSDQCPQLFLFPTIRTKLRNFLLQKGYKIIIY